MSFREYGQTGYSVEKIKEFPHDPKRGMFKSKYDHTLTCVAQMLGTPSLMLIPFITSYYGGVFFWIFYLILLIALVIPLLSMQTMIGQFSSTGFMSTYRMAPLMKGLSYAMLFLNLKESTKHSMEISLSIFTIFGGFKNMDENSITWEKLSIFGLIGLNFFIWAFVLLILQFGIEKLAKFLYLTLGISLTFLLILFVRFGFYPGSVAMIASIENSSLTIHAIVFQLFGAIICSIVTFGSGSGVFATLASFNTSFGNPDRTAVQAPLIIALVSAFTHATFYGSLTGSLEARLHIFQYPLALPVAGILEELSAQDAPNLWSAFFFIPWCLLEFNRLAILMFVITTSLSDEFIIVRKNKNLHSYILCIILFASSCAYALPTTSYLIPNYPLSGVLAKSVIFFVENITIAWIYGERRFIKDYEFLTKKYCKRWKFIFYKYLTPLQLLSAIIILLWCFITFLLNNSDNGVFPNTTFGNLAKSLTIDFFFCAVPLLIIPIYAIVDAFMKGCRCFGNDFIREEAWYPAPPHSRNEYEGNIVNILLRRPNPCLRY